MEEWRAALNGKAHGEEQRGSPAVAGMATTTTSLLCLQENVGDAKEETLEKAQELFQLCDKEEKGFITKQDMQRLQHELPLTSEQLESVFDSLDQGNNGYLTPVEFSMGLGKFIGMGDLRREETFESGWSDEQDQVDDEEQEERRFCAMMEQLGASQVFGGQSEVRDLWAQLRNEHPELLDNFEEFLFRVSSYIQEVHDEKESVEQVLKRKETDHDREVRRLYEEMEQQIKTEKERLLYQDSMKHRGTNTLLQKELKNREQELESIIAGQKQLEQQLQALNSEQVETRVQNVRLRHLNEELQEQLERSKRELEIAQNHLRQLHEEENQEQERKDRDVFRVSRNMQKEKQSLLRQLELLREMNKKLRDERDAFEAKKLLNLRARAVLVKHNANCFSCCRCCHHLRHAESLHCHMDHLSPQHPGLSHATSGADCP
ncbi:EF-hand calcium-binding domain-containing protein 4A [Microcaecilia unicolor]|uniref:EF-hand calcium-binding domain-containing protein 4A n=1 Tax=Microcaecilia unicolor TaxID=1415580 RepID=A0A6P7Y2P5_9AMPH|nr:EF-hand calcium-binding domain-containing protein 4A [Microcaecilia unicolor]